MATADLFYLYVIFLLLTSIRFSDESKSKSSKKPKTTPQISAVLLECPRERSKSSKSDCERQMMVHIRMSPTFQIDSTDKFLLLDEVYDERRRTKAKLMAPYVIEVSRGEPVIMYPLEFAKSIRCDTCGHGSDNSTTSNTGKLCGKSSPFSLNEEATVSDDPKLNAPAQSSVQETGKEYHPARGAKAEVKTDEQQKHAQNQQRKNEQKDRDEDKFIDNEDSERTASVGWSPDEGESNDGLTIDVVAVDDGNLVRLQSRSKAREEDISSSEMGERRSLYDTDTDYEIDDYDERDMDGEQLMRRGPGTSQEKNLRGLRAGVSPSQSTLKLDEAIQERKNLFREVERLTEEARLATMNAFRRTQSQQVETVNGPSLAADRADKKQRTHERVRQDSTRDYSNMGEGSIRGGNQRQSRLLEDYELIEGMEPQSARMPHLADTKNNRINWLDAQYPMDAIQSYQGSVHRKVGNLNRETASLLPGGAVRLFHPQQGPEEESSDELQGRQYSYSSDIDAAGEEINAVDYRYDTAVRELTPETESGSNIAKTDNSVVGEEFYLNTLNYPQGNHIFAKPYSSQGRVRDVVDNSKLSGYDGLMLSKSENHRALQRIGSEHKQDRRRRFKVKTDSTKDSGRNLHERTTGSLERRKSRERHSDDSSLNPIPKVGLATPSGMSSRSNGDPSCNTKAGSTGEGYSKFASTDKVIPRGSNAPGDAVETPVTPYFPSGLHNPMEEPQSVPLDSKYRFFEEVPAEHPQHQPQYVRGMGDPNLKSELESPKRRVSTKKYSQARGLNKRSYLVYDDLTMRDTYGDIDDADGISPVDVPLVGSKIPPTNDGDSLCKTCSPKSTCRCDRHNGRCECDDKTPIKKIRSVSEAWYSVFNMSAPLQFLTTRVGIYRRRHDTWWKIVPSITLTSLSGIYANGNLSILFSSHVDIFQLKRSLTLSHHKLVIPRISEEESAFGELSTDPREIFAVDSAKFDFNAIHDENKETGSEKDRLCQTANEARQRQRHHRSHSISEGVFSIGDFGFFPTQMNAMQKCPTGDNRLCLNLLDEAVPAFTIKIKQPFLENALVFADFYHVRIISVISDATTKGALQVAVVLVNEYFVAHEFAVCICDCPMTCGAKTTVRKDLPPHSAERLSFLLPLEESKAKKYECTARCLCIWDCGCHCIPDLVSHDDYNVCRKLSKNDEDSAGFVGGKGSSSRSLPGWGLFWWQMSQYTFALLCLMLFLGFLKASLGALGLHGINRMGYNYVQPLLKYENASRWRRFFINTLFFVVLPFIFCCKCFMPSEEDLLVASTVWQCSLLQRDVSDDSSGGGSAAGGSDGTRNGDAGGGWKPYERHRYNNNDDDGAGGGGTRGRRRGEGRGSENHRRVRYGNNILDDDDEEETILSQRFESGDGSQIVELGISHTRLNEYLVGACEYDDEEEERDTNYVLQALTESRESIRKLLSTQCNEGIDPSNPRARQAEEYVRKLVAAKIVYRIFDKPLENVDVPVGRKYSIRGYFVPSVGPGYQYFTPSPLAQLRRITANTTAILLPPVMLHAEEFSREYNSKMEVLQACDLSVCPPRDAPCINSSNVADPSQLTRARTLDISSSQVIEPIEQPVGDATNGTMRKPLSPFDNALLGAKDNLIGDASNESNSMAR